MKAFLKVALGAVIVAAFGAAGLWGTEFLLGEDSAQAAQGRSEGQTFRVGVTSPERVTVDDSISAVGTIYPVRSVELRPLSAGRVVEVAVDPGQRLSENELILRLDDRAETAALTEARATLDEAQQNFNRIEELSQQNVAAEAQFEEARAMLRRAEANVQMAEAALEDRTLRAPFDGTLGLIDIDPGQFIDTSTEVTLLTDLTRVEARFALPERYYARVEPSQTVRFSTQVYPDETFEGVVTVRAAEVARGSRSFDVRAEIENSDRRLRGGMFVRAEIVFGSGEAIAVPDDAIISEGNTTFLYTVADGTARRTEVTLGGSAEAGTVIRDGLDPEAQVVVTGWDDLSDGASVEVAEDVPEEALQ